MIQIINCDECDGGNIPMDAVYVEVSLKKSHYCGSCHNAKSERTGYFFCSEECFNRYIKKVAIGEAEFKFDK